MRKHARASIHPAVTAFQSLQKKRDAFGSHRANSCIHREEEEEDDEEVKEEKEEDDAL